MEEDLKKPRHITWKNTLAIMQVLCATQFSRPMSGTQTKKAHFHFASKSEAERVVKIVQNWFPEISIEVEENVMTTSVINWPIIGSLLDESDVEILYESVS